MGRKNEHFKLACDAYRLIDQHPARERLVRINHKLGKIEERDELLSEIYGAPLSEEEEQFAQRFGKKEMPDITQRQPSLSSSPLRVRWNRRCLES